MIFALLLGCWPEPDLCRLTPPLEDKQCAQDADCTAIFDDCTHSCSCGALRADAVEAWDGKTPQDCGTGVCDEVACEGVVCPEVGCIRGRCTLIDGLGDTR